MTRKRPSKEQPANSRFGMAEQVYEALRAQLFDRQLLAGARLNIDKLARDLGVSATPVREAVNRLVADGLAIYEPYAGYTLTPADDGKGTIKLMRARKLIEVYSAQIGAETAPRSLVREMIACTKDMSAAISDYRYNSFKVFDNRDNDFHDLIVHSPDNPYLVDAYRPIETRVRMLRMYYAGGSTDMNAVIAEHREIQEAYEARDGKRAAAAVGRHLEAAGRRLTAMAEQFVNSVKIAPLQQSKNPTAVRRG